MSTQTGPIAISPRFSMSSVPALPGVITTYWLKSLRLASDLSIVAFCAGSYGPFSSLSPSPLFAATQPMTKPTPDMPFLTPLYPNCFGFFFAQSDNSPNDLGGDFTRSGLYANAIWLWNI